MEDGKRWALENLRNDQTDATARPDETGDEMDITEKAGRAQDRVARTRPRADGSVGRGGGCPPLPVPVRASARAHHSHDQVHQRGRDQAHFRVRPVRVHRGPPDSDARQACCHCHGAADRRPAQPPAQQPGQHHQGRVHRRRRQHRRERPARPRRQELGSGVATPTTRPAATRCTTAPSCARWSSPSSAAWTVARP